MIERYAEHAANERTFLAWVRTAIAVMAFGFLVEKFDLFIVMTGMSVGRTGTVGGQTIGNIAGLVLIFLGGATMALAIIRFRRTARDIESADVRKSSGERVDITLGGLLVVLGTVIFVYLAYTTLSQM
jgi:putative membrane protein